MVFSGEVRLAASLALFAIAGFIFYRFRYYMVWDQKLQEPAWPQDVPRHVKVWIGIRLGCALSGHLLLRARYEGQTRLRTGRAAAI